MGAAHVTPVTRLVPAAMICNMENYTEIPFAARKQYLAEADLNEEVAGTTTDCIRCLKLHKHREEA